MAGGVVHPALQVQNMPRWVGSPSASVIPDACGRGLEFDGSG